MTVNIFEEAAKAEKASRAICGNPATATPCTNPSKDQCDECLAFSADAQLDSSGHVRPTDEALITSISSDCGVSYSTARIWVLETAERMRQAA